MGWELGQEFLLFWLDCFSQANVLTLLMAGEGAGAGEKVGLSRYFWGRKWLDFKELGMTAACSSIIDVPGSCCACSYLEFKLNPERNNVPLFTLCASRCLLPSVVQL